MVSKARDDLPEPDRPVMTTSLSRGRSTSIFLRLWTRAPRTFTQSCAMYCSEFRRKPKRVVYYAPSPPRRLGARERVGSANGARPESAKGAVQVRCRLSLLHGARRGGSGRGSPEWVAEPNRRYR